MLNNKEETNIQLPSYVYEATDIASQSVTEKVV
jgi:hypothetical protein